ncbi:hypothetical protein cyc_02447 [Cyclospora cayetanensis]|uniref:Uncharacterized protein n=1 Tax=Cyclospora cayetanensis TaxID=88456 RepID=A0A1D3D8Q1_9EIME|nr:hypothetical protein cyc_02447 [Cyclospora cayetanensis]
MNRLVVSGGSRARMRLLHRPATALRCLQLTHIAASPAAVISAATSSPSPPCSRHPCRPPLTALYKQISFRSLRHDSAGSCLKATNNGGSKSLSSDSRSLEARMAEVEKHLERLQGVVEEHERHLKEFVIEKTIDLEDEIRELGQRWKAANEGQQQQQQQDNADAASPSGATTAPKASIVDTSEGGDARQQGRLQQRPSERHQTSTAASDGDSTSLDFETIDVAIVENHPETTAGDTACPAAPSEETRDPLKQQR